MKWPALERCNTRRPEINASRAWEKKGPPEGVWEQVEGSEWGTCRCPRDQGGDGLRTASFAGHVNTSLTCRKRVLSYILSEIVFLSQEHSQVCWRKLNLKLKKWKVAAYWINSAAGSVFVCVCIENVHKRRVSVRTQQDNDNMNVYGGGRPMGLFTLVLAAVATGMWDMLCGSPLLWA